MEANFNVEDRVSCRISSSVAKYVERELGNLGDIFKDLPHSEQYLRNPFNWTTLSVQTVICDRAAKLLNDDEFMYRVGLEALELKSLGGLEFLVKFLGSPNTVYRSFPRYSRFFNRQAHFKTQIIGSNKATVTLTISRDNNPSHHTCFYTQGILTAIPKLWGFPTAQVRENQCMCEPQSYRKIQPNQYGANSCEYIVTWQEIKTQDAAKFKSLFTKDKSSGNFAELEEYIISLEDKNADLIQRNQELAKVREIALSIGSLRTIDEVYQHIVELARDISGMRFVAVEQVDGSGQYVMTPYYSRIRDVRIKSSLKALGFDFEKQLGKYPTSNRLKFPVSKLQLGHDFLTNPRTIVRDRLSDLLKGFWPRPLCNAVQKLVGIKKFVIVPIIISEKVDTALVFLIEKEVSLDILEMVAAHCSIAIKNVSMLEEKENALKQLGESQDKLSLTFDNVIDGIFLTDPAGNILQLNISAIKMYGFDNKEEIIGNNFLELIDLKERKEAKKQIYERIIKEELGTLEYTFIKKDGSRFIAEIHASFVRDASGSPRILVAIVRDITNRRKIQERLRFLSSITEQVSDGVIGTDLHHRIIYVNEAAQKMWGYNSEELVGLNLYEFLDLPEMIKEVSSLTNAFAQNNYLLNITLGHRKDGKAFTCELKISPIFDETWKISSYVCIQRDMTEQKALEAERLKIDKLDSIGTLAGGIAHDFNNLLTSILGNLELTKRYLESGQTDSISEILLDSIEACWKARDLTGQLLTFSRGGAPVKKLIKVVLLLKDTTIFSLRGSRSNSYFSLPDDLWNIEADEGQIIQVISNIVINAEQSMPQGGKVIIGARNILVESKSTLPLKLGNYIEINIRDEGVGIPEQNLKRIFDPYFTTKQKGYGLGLASAFAIVKNHGGYITVESETSIGTTFRIYLPATKKPIPDVATNKNNMSYRTKEVSSQGRILIMDDQEMIRKMLGSMLNDMSYEVVAVESGTQAIEKYYEAIQLKKPFKAVILDLTIPGGMGGGETINKLCEIDPFVKAIASSGYAIEPIMSNLKTYGFCAALTKPYSIAQLEDTLNKVLHKGK